MTGHPRKHRDSAACRHERAGRRCCFHVALRKLTRPRRCCACRRRPLRWRRELPAPLARLTAAPLSWRRPRLSPCPRCSLQLLPARGAGCQGWADPPSPRLLQLRMKQGLVRTHGFINLSRGSPAARRLTAGSPWTCNLQSSARQSSCGGAARIHTQMPFQAMTCY